ncbi:MAG: alpha/beta fold hydrolase [Candidatus Sericytochromatia bacterium]
MKKTLLTIAISIILSNFYSNKALAKDPTIDGYWQGELEVMGSKLKININIDTDNPKNKYTIQIPEQTKKELDLSNFSKNDKNIKFELAAPMGSAYFIGEIKNEEISGKFLQNGFEGTFKINRSKKEVDSPIKKEKSAIYNEEDIYFKNNDITLAGTLSYPKNGSNFPAIILITGSGPQNRDEEIFGFKPFQIIADYFTQKGFAVLRYDDRGIGESTGSMMESDSQDFAQDVEKAIDFLKNRKEINPKKIGLFGHSEGGIIVNMVASKNKDVAFGIMLAGTAINGAEIIKDQSYFIGKAEGEKEEELKNNQELLNKIFKVIQNKNATNQDWANLKNNLKQEIKKQYDKMKPELKNQIKDFDKYSETTAEGMLSSYKSKWFNFFANHEPSDDIKKVNIPVLAIFGEKDLQVSAKLNIPKMKEIFKETKQTNYEIITINSANHLFQKANTGAVSEYEKLPKEFTPDLLDKVYSWIKDKKIL